MLWTCWILFWFYRPPLQLQYPPRPLLVPEIQAFVSYWERYQREWSLRPIVPKSPTFLNCFWHPRCDSTKIDKKRTNDTLNVLSNRNLEWIDRTQSIQQNTVKCKQIQRMHSPTTNGATDMLWMSHQTEKYKRIHRMFPPEKDFRVRIGNPLWCPTAQVQQQQQHFHLWQ
jgi:hypothetical protein